MNRDEELAWRLTRSAKVVALLEKPIERVAQAASLSIIDSLDEISVDLLTEWLETGRAHLVGTIGKNWGIRKDNGLEEKAREVSQAEKLAGPEANKPARPAR